MALAVTLVKIVEFLLDSQVLFFPDSLSFLMNALGAYLVDFRSYVYGYVIRIFAVPFHSLQMVVATQMVLGGFTAWLLGAMLMRFFGVGKWIALFAALLFAIDPAQVVYEHMVMAETAALTVLAVYLVTALFYLERPAVSVMGNSWLAVLSLLGILLVSLRINYLPMVILASVAIPLAGWWSLPGRPRRALALGLLVSCGSTAIAHTGYRRLTGRLEHRSPRYSSMNGFFLMATVAPLLRPGDSIDPRVAEVVAEQGRSTPLAEQPRWVQLWQPFGLRTRLLNAFGGDQFAADEAASHVARAAIRRDPLGFTRLAVNTYRGFWTNIPRLPEYLGRDNGTLQPLDSFDFETSTASRWFDLDISRQHEWNTLTRRYHIAARYWFIFLLVSPLLSVAAWRFGPVNRRGLAFLAVSACLILVATCFGASETVYRYLHPFSFFGLAALAVLAQRCSQSTPVLPSR